MDTHPTVVQQPPVQYTVRRALGGKSTIDTALTYSTLKFGMWGMPGSKGGHHQARALRAQSRINKRRNKRK